MAVVIIIRSVTIIFKGAKNIKFSRGTIHHRYRSPNVKMDHPDPLEEEFAERELMTS